MKKSITNNKHLTSAVAMAAILVLAGCSNTTETENAVTETEESLATESSEDVENTETYVPDTELETTETETTEIAETETTETETSETEFFESETESTDVSEAETTIIESELSPKTETIGYTDTEVASMNSTGVVDPSDPGTWTPPHEGMVYVVSAGRWMEPDEASAYGKPADGFDRAVAEEIWAYMNAERTAAGLSYLPWDEKVYNFACRRAQQIVTDFSHNGNDSNYAENILGPSSSGDPYFLNMLWHNSPRHYDNYMSQNHTGGACAVYVYDGLYYAVENFTLADGYYMANNTTREYNGQTLDITVVQAEAFDSGNIWVASNGVLVFIQSNGNVSAGDGIHSLEELQEAVNEYYSSH